MQGYSHTVLPLMGSHVMRPARKGKYGDTDCLLIVGWEIMRLPWSKKCIVPHILLVMELDESTWEMLGVTHWLLIIG